MTDTAWEQLDDDLSMTTLDGIECAVWRRHLPDGQLIAGWHWRVLLDAVGQPRREGVARDAGTAREQCEQVMADRA